LFTTLVSWVGLERTVTLAELNNNNYKIINLTITAATARITG
jgi:hypothetical protein